MKKDTNKIGDKKTDKNTDKKNALVVGGAGFIGSRVVDALIDQGYSVHVLDNLLNGRKEWVNKEATLQVGDMMNVSDLDEAFKKVGRGAYVFLLACLPRVPFSIDFPRETHKANIDGVFNVLIGAKEYDAKRVIYSSSSSAYGDQKTMPLVETMKPNPKSPYGLQKLTGEYYAKVMSEVYGMETVSLRYFNVYGPRQEPNGAYAQAIPKFLDQAKHKKPITITGDGEQTRDCTHLFDVVEANLLAATSPKVGKGEVINIGSGKSYSMNKVAKLIGGEVIYIPARLEPKNTCADIRLAKKLLGWAPKMTLEKGIKELKKELGMA